MTEDRDGKPEESEGPARSGRPPGSPVEPTTPPMHCATMSKAGQFTYGLSPVRGSPNPRTAA